MKGRVTQKVRTERERERIRDRDHPTAASLSQMPIIAIAGPETWNLIQISHMAGDTQVLEPSSADLLMTS